MALNIGNKVYRNLQEQVGYNSEQIDKIFSILDGIDYEDHVVVIGDITTPLNEDEMAIVREPVSFLVYQNKLYFKDSSDSDNYYFSAVINIEGTNVISIRSFQISVNILTGELEALESSFDTYSKNEEDLKITNLQTMISSIASGSPKGVYATLADLETAFPTGADGIYVVSADGHWYYWNGLAWTSGGVYQATQLGVNSVKLEQLKRDISDNFESINLFDKRTIISGGYWGSSGNVETQPNSQYSSQFIPVNYGTTYKVTTTLSGFIIAIATYDESGNFIARQNLSTDEVTFANGVAYIRLSLYNNQFDASFMFCEKSKTPNQYQDYSLGINTKGLGAKIADPRFDDVSENPVQNKVITNRFFNTNTNVKVNELIGISQKILGYGSDYGDDGAIVFNNAYDSYYLIVDEDAEIYVSDIIANNQYYSICHGINCYAVEERTSDIIFRCHGNNRYRNLDNNLPNENNKLSVSKGDVLIFSFFTGQIFSINGLQKQFNLKKLPTNYNYEKTATELTIDTPKARYIFRLVQDSNIRIDTWRLYAGYLKRSDGSLFNMWSNSDAEGVVKISGENDYIGGYHGDETMTSIKIFADGIDITNETNKKGEFENISIYVNSDVYHCNTSSTPDVVAFKRSKQLIFNKDKVEVCNNFIAQQQLAMADTPLSLFQCDWKENGVEVAESYSVKPYYKLYTMQETSEGTYPANNENMTEAYLETTIHPIVFRVIDCNGTARLGVVAQSFVATQNRIKFYYYNNTSTSGTILNQNESLYSHFEFEIK